MDKYFRKFLKNIKLTDPQKADAKTKTKSVCETLHNKYYPNQTYDGRTKFLVGSYGKHTNIRPPKDIDVIFRMPDEEFARYDALSGNKQSQLLQDVRAVLKDKFDTTEKINAFGKVVVINFKEGTHSVELLPGWQLPSGGFRIPNTENSGSWDVWDPLAEDKNIDQSSIATKRTRSLIRMLKAWVRVCAVPIKSFILEILVVEFLQTKYGNSLDKSYAEVMVDFFEYLKTKRYGSVFSHASSTSVSLGDDWYTKAESALGRAKKALEFEQDEKLRDASLEWKKVFGDDFPIATDPETTAGLVTTISILRGKYPSSSEQDITNDYGFPVKIALGYQVTLDAEVKQNGFQNRLLSSFLASKFPLLKGNKLTFKVVQNNVPQPHQVYWKVRNFGDEAQRADDLRGEISPDKGFREKVENTKYHGDHYVECYIITNNVCVAIGKILVPIGKEYA